MNAVKEEDTLRQAIRDFVKDGSPKNLKDALKILQKSPPIKNPPSPKK
jgi:hypothetical protein